MRVILSFLLTLFIYVLIIAFLYFTFFYKKEKKEVLIHTAIIMPKNKINHTKVVTKKSVKRKLKKSGSKENITKSGDIDFKDIFKNVNENIPTKKIKLKKEEYLSRFKAKKILSKLKNLKSVNISYKTSSNVKKEKVDELIEKISKVWNLVSDIPGEYATIKFVNNNGYIEVYILDSNLDKQKEQILIQKLKSINFDKNINLIIKFQTKATK